MGEGVADARKGMFSTHAATVAKTLKGAHVTLQARSEADVDPDLIRKRLQESGGSRYSIHKEAPVKMSAPAPVGSAYVPVGRPDIASLTAKAKKEEPIEPVGTSYEPKRNELASIRAAQNRAIPTPPAPTTPAAPPAPFSSLTRPAAVTAPAQSSTNVISPIDSSESHISPPKAFSSRTATPVPSNLVAPSAPSITKASEARERPEAVGTSYTPVSLGKPGKLGNRWNPGAAAQETPSSTPSFGANRNVSSGSGGKMTWSERQAAAKKQAEAEDAKSRNLGQTAPPPSAPPPPPMPGRSQISMPLGADSDNDQEEEEGAPPPRECWSHVSYMRLTLTDHSQHRVCVFLSSPLSH